MNKISDPSTPDGRSNRSDIRSSSQDSRQLQSQNENQQSERSQSPVQTQAQTQAPAPKLSIKNLEVVYTGRNETIIPAVKGFDLEIEDKPECGEIVVLLGPSGCGKSTVLRCVAGLLSPKKGQILVSGKIVSGVGRDRGMVFQQYTSFDWLTVRENVEYGLRLQGVAAQERRDRAEHYLELVGLDGFANQYPQSLSGGMKQRVAIARTLINEPKLLLLDEPFGALDAQTRWEMQTLILDIARRKDNTILLVTHDVGEAVYVADSCYVLAKRPTHVIHRIDVPDFGERSPTLKISHDFRAIEQELLGILHAPETAEFSDNESSETRRARDLLAGNELAKDKLAKDKLAKDELASFEQAGDEA